MLRVGITSAEPPVNDFTPVGGGGGGTPFTLACDVNEVLVGVQGMTATYVNQVSPVCTTINQSGQWIGTPVTRGITGKVGTTNYSKMCPAGSAISGFRGRFSQYVNQLDFECRALTSNGKLTGTGTFLGAVGPDTGTAAGPWRCDTNNPGYVWAIDPNQSVSADGPAPDDPEPELAGPAGKLDPINHPFAFQRPCKPRRVVITHSGAFAKYVGRLDLVVSNDPAKVSPTGNPADYDPVNKFEIQTIRYQPFPITADIPEDPVIVDMLQPYRRQLDYAADLDILVGYSPDGSKRISSTGGDSPLGNVVGNAIWLRLGIQTDFSMTNSTGIRADLNPGPVTVEQMFNIFPFENSITKMQLSGTEVQELFDFSARRSASRGCTSQIQIAGARVRLDCGGCTRLDVLCKDDADCVAAGRDACNTATGKCVVNCDPTQTDNCSIRLNGSICDSEKKQCVIDACAEQVYIGTTSKVCQSDANCSDDPAHPLPGSCSKADGAQNGLCLSEIKPTNLYELATSNYLAGGGSGFRVLQRNTTQLDTKVQQRDALIDYLRAGRPCGFSTANATDDGLKACVADADCMDDKLVCACSGHAAEQSNGTCATTGTCDDGSGRCVPRLCRDDVAAFHNQRCAGVKNVEACKTPIAACPLAGEECKLLTCIDGSVGSFSDNRVEMIGR